METAVALETSFVYDDRYAHFSAGINVLKKRFEFLNVDDL